MDPTALSDDETNVGLLLRERVRRTERVQLAAALANLRREAGNPSYARLHRLSASLAPATISDVLNAKSTPRLEFVLAFVEAVGTCADLAGITLPAEERSPTTWRRRWSGEPPTATPVGTTAWLREAHLLVTAAAQQSPDPGLIRAELLLGAALRRLAVDDQDARS